MAEHKGFDPSRKKLTEARKKGQLPKAALLSQSMAYILIFACVFSGLQIMWSNFPQMIEYCLSMPCERIIGCSQQIISEALFLVFVSLLLASVIATLVEAIQVRFEFCWDPLMPRIERLNLFSGFKRLLQGLKKVILIILKFSLVVFLIKSFTADSFSLYRSLISDLSGRQALNLIPEITYLIYLNGLLLLLTGCAEFCFNRRRFLREHSMSLDEVRRELKEEEGDPHIRAQRKALHESVVMQEIVKRVRSSKVIIVD